MPHPNDTDNEDYTSVNVPSRNNTGTYGSVIYFVTYKFQRPDRHLNNIYTRKHYLSLYDFIDKDDRVDFHTQHLFSMVEYNTCVR